MKSNFTKKKLNKEKKSLKKKMCLVFHQHNIGCCEVQEKKEKDLYLDILQQIYTPILKI